MASTSIALKLGSLLRRRRWFYFARTGSFRIDGNEVAPVERVVAARPSSIGGRSVLRATLLVQLIVLSAVGCSSDHGAVSRIPGTERAATRSTLISTNEHYAISLSPDERYLVFWEWGKTVIEARKSGQSYTRAVCIDLVTGERTGFDPEATEHTWDEHVVGADFVPQCWYNEKCYIPFRRRTLAFGPGSPRGVYADVPGELTCSDCAPRALLKKTIRRRLGSSWRRAYEATHRFSIPWKDGRFGDRRYQGTRESFAIVSASRVATRVAVILIRVAGTDAHAVGQCTARSLAGC